MKIKIIFFTVLLCISFCFKTFAQTTNVQDSLALVDLYNSTNGAHWDRNTNWLAGPVDTWYGVTVKNTRVTDINEGDNNLTGPLPASLGNLDSLVELWLFSNHLNGSIPSELGKLSKLTILHVEENELSGSIPPELSNLSNLYYLVLFNNQLSGKIPPELGNLANLSILSLGSNQLSGSIPPELGNLLNMFNLSLGYNQLSGSIPPELSNFINLYYLSLNNNQLSGSIPVELANCVNLYSLDLEHNQLTGNIPSELGNLANLHSLHLTHNQLSGNIPSELKELSHLQELYLDSNEFSGRIPPELGNFKHLKYLFLNDNQLSGTIPPELGNLLNVRQFYLENNQLNGSLPPELGNLHNIFNFNLSNNQLSGSIPSAFINIGLFNEINQVHINLSYNRFTFAGLENLVTTLPETIYSPQTIIPANFFGDSSLTVSAGGTLSNNTYTWFMVGQPDPVIMYADSVFQPSKYGKYYAAVTNSVCTKLTLYTDTINYSNVLPVTIANLKATQQKNLVQLSWFSVTETNISHYEILRSANSVNFNFIGSIPAKNNGVAQEVYMFNDQQPQKGNNYYRLKMIDKDGKPAYSNIVLVNVRNNKTMTIAYPDPAKDILHVQTNISTSLSLINLSGKILLTVNINGSHVINVSQIAPGIYFLRNNRSGAMQRIIIVR